MGLITEKWKAAQRIVGQSRKSWLYACEHQLLLVSTQCIHMYFWHVLISFDKEAWKIIDGYE
jgi:hypothetical protein